MPFSIIFCLYEQVLLDPSGNSTIKKSPSSFLTEQEQQEDRSPDRQVLPFGQGGAVAIFSLPIMNIFFQIDEKNGHTAPRKNNSNTFDRLAVE
jgi:hypothetical protein